MDLSALFSPRSVAVIGASRYPQKVGAIVLKNIISSGFAGKIYPVNPNADLIDNLQCFKDVASLPEIPDLAVVAIPVPQALEALIEIGEKSIKNAVVFSAGFKETGEEGKKLEDILIEIAKKYNINVLGPNCLGFVNNLCPINVTFSEVVNKPGNLRFISQSGALASSLFDWCKSNNLGFSEFVTLGNKAVINENDILEYFQNSSGPIGLYLESISNGAHFLKLAKNISKKEPVFILKPGKTQAAAKAMMSHTGAIAGEDAVLDAVLQQAGVIRAATLEDFFDLSRTLAWSNPPAGPKVAIISNAGGPAVISADAVASSDLELAQFDEQTHLKLQQILPRSAGILNPVDVLGDALADRYAKASEIILQNDDVNTLVVILTPQIMTQIEQTAESLGNLSRKYNKIIFCSFIGGSLVQEGEQKLNELQIPHFRFPEQAIATLAKLWRYKKNQSEKDNTPQIPSLQLTAISKPESIVVSTLEEAKSFIQKIGFPVALKISSPKILHKRAIGGVFCDIQTNLQLEAAWEKLRKHNLPIQVQKFITGGVEVIIGVKEDPTFGKVLLFGAGGSNAELICDRNLHLLPIDLSEARKLVKKSKIFPQLKEFNLEKLYEAILILSNTAQTKPEIADIEINPVIVTEDNVWAVDSKVILK